MEPSEHPLIAAHEPIHRQPGGAVQEAVLGALLVAHKAGTLGEWLAGHPRLGRWIATRLLRPVLGTAGHALHREAVQADALGLLLTWAVVALRPDGQPGLHGIERAAWIDRTSWRPMLSVMCQFEFAPVPDFPDRYRRRADESPASNLCGLWSVGASTFYRYLEKGKRQMAGLLREQATTGRHTMALRMAVDQAVAARIEPADDAAAHAWRMRQAAEAIAARDCGAALWHLLCAGDVPGFVHALQRHSVELANEPDTDALVDTLIDRIDEPRALFDLHLARAAVWRSRADAQREQQALEQALHIASRSEDKLMLGIVHGALGKFHEPRDSDRAFSFYQDSAEFLWQAGLGTGATSAPAEVMEQYVATLVRLAWLYVLRNDPRSKAVLDRAEQLRLQHPLSPDASAMLEQTWGEYWRRAGELRRALEHKHRALNIYERIGDRQAVLKTASNLSLIYGEAREFERAIEHSQRVLALAGTMVVDPEIVASTHLNLGVTYFWQADYRKAIDEYALALELGLRASLRLIVRRAHYNLAEAHYICFRQERDPEDERRGDAHAEAALAAWPDESDPAHVESTRGLKREILGPGEDRAYDRLMPQEFAAHYAEMSQVQRQRATLAVPVGPEAHIRAYLSIANAYLAISVKEREAALALIAKHGLEGRFAAELGQLRSTFDRQLTHEEQLAAQWRGATIDLLGEERSQLLLQHMLRGDAITKSGYAALCGVGPATASKHLVGLAERGLLLQVGKGPSTRYTLPPAGSPPVSEAR